MSEKSGAPGIHPDLVRELAAILRDTGLTEIEVEHGALKLRLARGLLPAASAPAPAYPVTQPALPAPALAPEAAPPAAVDLRAHPGAVASPMVGTAYLAPEEGAAPFVKVGDMVAQGQTLLIVEAMKTFNPIPAPRAGKVMQIAVGNAQPVEYGEVLLVLE
jgi:acetyl-CoA carboxylase biotin carboxyl carrier protein